jgi:peptide-methionine (S)-S-oxide reductase
MGDHTESLQIDFDPAQITFTEIAQAFWQMHNPCATQFSRQYMSTIWFHDDQQKSILDEIANGIADQSEKSISTPIAPLDRFYLAEDYHQKYRLQSLRKLMKTFRVMYPRFEDFNQSTAAARLNGFASGRGAQDLFLEEAECYGIPKEQLEAVVRFRK